MQNDVKSLQGTWNVKSLEIEGGALPEGLLGGSKIIIDGDRFTTFAMGATYAGAFSVNTKNNPSSIDMNFTAGPEKGNTSLGIYEINGDSWKLCLTISGKTRPVKFATSPKSGHALETLVRESADAKAGGSSATTGQKSVSQFADVQFEPIPELEGEWSMVSGVRDGHPMDKMMVSTGKRVGRGYKTTVSFGGQVMIEAKYTVDTSKMPNEMDYYHTGGMSAGNQQPGIYELADGILKIAFASPGGPRPSDFTSKVGDGRTVAVWKKKL
jgi:uncharacterized protein (TIGR03067 family)